MADVLGEAVVEIIPLVEDFGKDLNKQMKGVTKDVSGSVKDIDREFASLSGSIEESFAHTSDAFEKSMAEMTADFEKYRKSLVEGEGKAATEVEKAWREARGSLAQGILDIQAKHETAANKTEAAWRKTTATMSKEFIEAGLEAGKSATQIQKEFERGAKASEKALANLAKDSAKQIESDMKRAAKATEKALADSAKLAKKEYDDIAKAAKKAADEEEKAHKAAAKAADESDSTLGKLGSKIMSLTGLFGKLGAAGGSIGSILPFAAALVSTLEAAAGAALILPGALAAIGLAGATLKIAFTGIGEALSADNAKELQAAMENLPPTAQEFVKALRNVKDEFEGVRKGVQSVFFSGLDKQIDELGAVYLPVVTRGLLGIATELNHAAAGFMNMLKEASNVKSIDSIFDSARVATKNLGEALAPIGQALLDIADVGASVFADLTDGAGTAAQKFADFIRELKDSGRLEEIMRGGIEALKVLGGLLADIGAIAKNVFGPLIEGAGKLGTPLNAVLDTFREFTASSEFIDMMRDLGKIMGDLAGAIGTVLGAALKAVMPFVQTLIEMLGDHLAKVLPIVVPFFEKLAGFLGDVLTALTPLLEPLFELVQKLLPPMTELLAKIFSSIDITKLQEFATTISESLSKAVTDLLPHIIEFADKLGDLFVKMGPLISTFLDFATNVLPILITGLAWLGGQILDFISFFLDPLILAWQGISWVVQQVWQEIKDWIVRKVAEILAGIEIISELPGKFADWFGRMRQAAIDKIADIVNDIRALPGKILSALGDLGGLLWDAGVRVITGFINGLRSKVAEIGSILSGITSSIPMLKGPPVVDAKLLTPNGVLIMQGLVDGFKKGEKGVNDHLNNLTSNISKQMQMGQGAQSAMRSMNSMTTKLGAGNAITQAAIAEQAAMRSAFTLSAQSGNPDVDVTVVMGNEVLDAMVTDVIVKRDRRTKRAVTAGGRRTP